MSTLPLRDPHDAVPQDHRVVHNVDGQCDKNGFDFVEATFDFVAFDNVASTLLLGVDGVLEMHSGCLRYSLIG